MPADLVVGGGVAGLVLARRLALGGRAVTLLEATDRLGGQVARQELAGVGLDAAAESFALRGGAVARLLDELGLGDDIVSPNPAPAWLHRADGSAVPLPATALLGIPADPSAADVRRAVGRRAALRARLDAILPARFGREATSLDELVRGRMGRGVLDGLVAPIVRGVHSREPDGLPLAVAHPRLMDEFRKTGSLSAAVRDLRAASPAGSQVAGIRGGMHRLVDALVDDCRRLGVVIETGQRVDSVDVDGATVDGRQRPGRVLLAAANPVAPSPRRRITLVTLVAVAPAWDGAPRGTGLLVAAEAAVGARALTHLSAKWGWVAEALPGRHAVRLSYDDEPDDAVARAVDDATLLLGGAPERLVDARVATWERSAGGGAAPAASAVPAVGETVAGTGLASVVGQAEELARSLSDSSDVGGRGRMEG